jgi:D-sedoheptulose 7-phosphate isomerase
MILNYIELLNKISEHENMFYLMRNDVKLHKNLNSIIELLVSTLKNNNKILIAGNGGSASDAQHLTAEFVGRFKKERKALNVEALSTNTSILTAIGNDYSFDKIFSRQVEAKGSSGDVLIGFSTSGNSKNIVEAFKQSNKQHMINILFTGENVNTECAKYADYIVSVPSNDVARIQESHVFIYHVLAEYVEKEFI